MESRKKILVVDDSSTNVLLLEAVLLEKGHLIYTATTVKDAWISIEKDLPDLIILDLLMPKVNGYDLLLKLRSETKTKDIPVIIVSAVTEPEDIKRARSFGHIVDFIQKPVDIQQIYDLVDTVF